MKKQTVIKLLIISAFCLIGVSINQSSADAASWHKGTPKVLRGTYQGKRTSSAEGFGYFYKIASKYYVTQSSNMSQIKTVNLKYKKLRTHVYRIVGHTQKSGMVLGGHSDNVLYRKGKLLLLTDYASYKKEKMNAFKYSLKNPAKKTTHIKDGGAIVHM